MPSRFAVLAVSTDRVELRRWSRFLQSCGYDVRACADPATAVKWIEKDPPAMLLAGKLSSDEAAHVLRSARRQTERPFVACLKMCEELAPHEALDLIQAGWDDLLLSPVTHGELLTRLRSAARMVEFERRWSAQGKLDLSQVLVDRQSWIQRLDAKRSTAGRSPHPCGYVALVGIDSLDTPSRADTSESSFAADSIPFQACQQRLAASAVPGEMPGRWDRTTLAFFLNQHQQVEAEAWAEARLAEIQADDACTELLVSWGLVPIFSAGELDDYLEQAEDALQLARDSGGGIAATSQEVDKEEAECPVGMNEQLFTSTTGRDVMQPCALLLSAEDTPQQALRLLKQMDLPMSVVVDRQGQYLGTVTIESLQESLSGPPRGGRQTGSLRFLRQIITHPPHFAAETSLADLLSYFAAKGESASYAIVLHQRRPIGWVDCQFLASVNAAPTPDDLSPAGAPHAGSRFLVVASA